MRTTISEISRFEIPTLTDIRILEYIRDEEGVTKSILFSRVPRVTSTRIQSLVNKGLVLMKTSDDTEMDGTSRKEYSITEKGLNLLLALAEAEPFLQKVDQFFRKGSAV